MSSEESPPQDLGHARIGPDDGHLSLPTEVVKWEILFPGGDAYWAYDPSTDRLVVTRSQPSLGEHADYTRIDSTSVTDDGRVALLEEFTAEGDERPWTGYFEPDDMCYFSAPGDLLGEQLSYVLTERQHEAFWND